MGLALKRLKIIDKKINQKTEGVKLIYMDVVV